MEGCCYWYAPHGFLSLFSYIAQDRLHRVEGSAWGWGVSTHYSQLGPPTSILDQGKASQTCPQVTMIGVFSVEVASS